MPPVQIYVNTDVAPGGNGSLGNPYASMVEALTPIRIAGSTSSPYDFHLSGVAADPGVAGIYSTDHSIWEFTTDPINKIRMFGNNTTMGWNDSKYKIRVTDRHGIYNQYAAHIELYNIQVEIIVTDAGNHDAFRLSTANNDVTHGPGYFRFSKCVGRTGLASTNGTVRGFINSILGPGAGSGDVDIDNCLFFGRGTSTDIGFNNGDGNAWTQAHVRYYNCLVATCVFGLEDGIFVNCIATGCLFGMIGGLPGTDYCAIDDGNGIQGGGTHNNDNATPFTFVNAAARDYHLANTDGGARRLGMTNPAAGLFLDEFDGGVRATPWDIGPDQVELAASPLPPPGDPDDLDDDWWPMEHIPHRHRRS